MNMTEKEKVWTVCYGKMEEWADREDAMKFYKEGFECSDGCEAMRYANVFFELYDGVPVAWDGEEEPRDMTDEQYELFEECHPWLKEETE